MSLCFQIIAGQNHICTRMITHTQESIKRMYQLWSSMLRLEPRSSPPFIRHCPRKLKRENLCMCCVILSRWVAMLLQPFYSDVSVIPLIDFSGNKLSSNSTFANIFSFSIQKWSVRKNKACDILYCQKTHEKMKTNNTCILMTSIACAARAQYSLCICAIDFHCLIFTWTIAL